MVDREIMLAFLISLAIVSIITIVMHDRHYQSRGNKILENRVRTLEEIVSEWTSH